MTKHKYWDKNFYFVNTEILKEAQEFRSESNLRFSKNKSEYRWLKSRSKVIGPLSKFFFSKTGDS
jgi:hypothetical protein